jgi:N utilization substance protein B
MDKPSDPTEQTQNDGPHAISRPKQNPAMRPQAGLRREGREAAIQFLFHLDFQGSGAHENHLHESGPEALADADFWRLRLSLEDPDDPTAPSTRAPIAPKARLFAESLVRGVCGQINQLDALISKFSRNYQLSRLAAVDRNILRLAVYEILYNSEVPPVVAINEAIELAKQYGSEESGRFVNGVLDRIRAETPRPAREGARRKPNP